MKKLSAAVSRFCYNHPNFGIPNLMLYIVVGNVAVYLLDLLSSGTFSPMLEFIPYYLFQGQVWRLVTFLFVPSDTNVIFLAISLYFYYWIGSSLERAWGTARFTMFYLIGLAASILVGLLSCLVYGIDYPGAVTSTSYLNLSLFFSIATLYPDMQILLFFIIPVKIKWVAYLDAVVMVVGIFSCIGAGEYLMALLPVLAIVNYLIFFGEDLFAALRGKTGTFRHQTSRKTINFKLAARKRKAEKGYLHRCCVCGITDTQDPNMEFRYCSKCAGYRCYCSEHIKNHIHVTEE